MNSCTISIIIPVYNEEIGIKVTLDHIISLNLNKMFEIIVVNDGSNDNTKEIVKQYPVKLLSHKYNRGYGAALKTGILNSTGDKVITLDSDGQHDPKNIEKISSMLGSCDMVIGQRLDDSLNTNSRIVGKKLLKFVGEYLIGHKLPDFNSGFRGFDKNMICNILHYLPNGFSFSTTSTFAFLKENCIVDTFPITVNKRIGRESNVNFLKDGIKTLLLIIRVIMLFNPLKIFIPISSIIILGGISFTIYNLYNYGNVPTTGGILFITGINIFLFGLIADQISCIKKSIHQ